MSEHEDVYKRQLRESVLKSRFAMERFCYTRGGKISGGWTQNYGYIVETEHYLSLIHI